MQLSEKDQTYTGYLGRALDHVLGVRHCPVNRMTLCVTSDPEMEKCVKMKVFVTFFYCLKIFMETCKNCIYDIYIISQIALKAQLLKPELLCHRGHSQINCMQSIQSGYA